MINSVKLVFQYFYLLFQPLFQGFLNLGQKYKNFFFGFIVQMKTLKFSFKNSWSLLWYLRLTCFCSFFGRNWRHQKDSSKLTDLSSFSEVQSTTSSTVPHLKKLFDQIYSFNFSMVSLDFKWVIQNNFFENTSRKDYNPLLITCFSHGSA